MKVLTTPRVIGDFLAIAQSRIVSDVLSATGANATKTIAHSEPPKTASKMKSFC